MTSELRTILTALISTGVSLSVLDAVWLTVMSSRFYFPRMEGLLSGKVQWVPIILFYLLYTVTITFLIVLPSVKENTLVRCILTAGLLGITAYGTYNFTNHAIMKGWSWELTLVDMAWGTFMTALAASISFWTIKQLS